MIEAFIMGVFCQANWSATGILCFMYFLPLLPTFKLLANFLYCRRVQLFFYGVAIRFQ